MCVSVYILTSRKLRFRLTPRDKTIQSRFTFVHITWRLTRALITFESRFNHVWITSKSPLNHLWITFESHLILFESCLILFKSRLILFESRLILFESRLILFLFNTFESRLNHVWITFVSRWIALDHVKSRLTTISNDKQRFGLKSEPQQLNF